MGARPDITAWRPDVEGIDEVFHARFADHAYPMHTHDAWTLLIVDEVGYIPFDPEAAALFFALISSRYERRSLIVSSN